MSDAAPRAPASGESQADREWLPIGLALYALRSVLQATGDSLLALQYLFFDLDVNDPQVTPALAEEGVDVRQAPALEEYLCRRARPWMRRIDAGERRTVAWAEATRGILGAWVASRPEARRWAETVLAETESIDPGTRRSWEVALAEGRFPGREAARWIAAQGILEQTPGAAELFPQHPDREGDDR